LFQGKKIWFFWDTYEGQDNGLEDAERPPFPAKASFSIQKFLEIPSSRWFVLNEGQTLFLPGHLTHKVVTLEKYIGLSNFIFSLPSALTTLARWMTHEPLFTRRSDRERGEKVISELISLTSAKLHQLESGTDEEKMRWGYDYFGRAVTHFKDNNSTTNLLNSFSNRDRDLLDKIVHNY